MSDPIRDCAHGHKKGKCDTCDLIEAQARIALLEKKNADLKVELDNALGWYEKWQKIANERSKEILRLMEL